MRTVLLAPIGPSHPGNGLAHRVRLWREALASLGEVVTVVVPVSGPVADGDADVVEAPDPVGAEGDDRPRRAQGCTVELGHRLARRTRAPQPVDVVVAVRSYLGLVGAGLADGTGAALVVDLDDDDAAVADQDGDPREAERYRRLVAELRARADLVVAAKDEPALGVDAVVPNAVAVPPLAPYQRAPVPARLLMVGNLTYGPNRDGAAWILDEVLPLVRARRSDVVLDVVGPGSESLGGPGLVADLAPAYRSAAVALVPVRRGSGTRIKALEAWAHGVPVVATTLGVEGLGARDGVDLRVADTPEAFADAVVSLLDDPDEARRLADGRHRRVCEAFAWDEVAAGAAGLVRSAAARGGRVHVARTDVQVTETDDGLVVFDPSTTTAHHLNLAAGVVFVLCDGVRDEDAVASEMAVLWSLDEPPAALVATGIATLAQAGLVRRLSPLPASPAGR